MRLCKTTLSVCSKPTLRSFSFPPPPPPPPLSLTVLMIMHRMLHPGRAAVKKAIADITLSLKELQSTICVLDSMSVKIVSI